MKLFVLAIFFAEQKVKGFFQQKLTVTLKFKLLTLANAHLNLIS